MTWTAPPTYTTGQLITAAIANAQWRDNLLVLKTSVDDSGHLVDSVIRSISAGTTVVATDDLIICTANSFTVTLLTAVGRSGKPFTVTNTGSGTITMASTSSQTIQGLAAGSWTVPPGFSLTFKSDGANWVIV